MRERGIRKFLIDEGVERTTDELGQSGRLTHTSKVPSIPNLCVVFSVFKHAHMHGNIVYMNNFIYT